MVRTRTNLGLVFCQNHLSRSPRPKQSTNKLAIHPSTYLSVPDEKERNKQTKKRNKQGKREGKQRRKLREEGTEKKRKKDSKEGRKEKQRKRLREEGKERKGRKEEREGGKKKKKKKTRKGREFCTSSSSSSLVQLFVCCRLVCFWVCRKQNRRGEIFVCRK